MERIFMNKELFQYQHHQLILIDQNKLLIIIGLIIGVLIMKNQENGGFALTTLDFLLKIKRIILCRCFQQRFQED